MVTDIAYIQGKPGLISGEAQACFLFSRAAGLKIYLITISHQRDAGPFFALRLF